MDREEKTQKLAALEDKMRSDTTLPLREANLVFGEGNPDTDVLFIGEAPGFHEDRLSRPFVGRGGQLLDDCIKSIGWRREDVYITNIVKRRPPENRDPLPEEIAAYKPYLARQVEIINPKIVVALGRFAMNYFLPDAKISRDHGRVFKVNGNTVVPVFHPAAALRSTEVLKQLREDFRKLPEILLGKFEPIAADIKESKKEIAQEAKKFQNPLF